MKHLVFLSLSCFILASCGGGSSDDSQLNAGAALTLSQTQVSNSGLYRYSEGSYKSVIINVSTKIKNQIKNGKVAYFSVSQSNDNIASLNIIVQGESGTLNIGKPSFFSLDPGQYTSKITITGCWDQSCTDQFGSASLDYTFTMYALAEASVESINLERDISAEATTNAVNIDLKGFPINIDNLSFYQEYESTPAGWLTPTAIVENGTVSGIKVEANDIKCGAHKTELKISYTSDFNEKGSFTIPITYRVSSTKPMLAYASPLTLEADTPLNMTFIGCGLQTVNPEELSLQNLTNADITVHNDYRMTVTADALSEGIHSISMTNDVADFDVNVKAPKIIDEQSVFAAEGNFFPKTVFRDDHNDRIFARGNANGETTIKGAQLENGIFQPMGILPFDDALEVIVSNDGQTYFALYTKSVKQFDALSFELIVEHYAPSSLTSFYDYVSMTLNMANELILQRDGSGFSYLQYLNIDTGEFYKLSGLYARNTSLKTNLHRSFSYTNRSYGTIVRQIPAAFSGYASHSQYDGRSPMTSTSFSADGGYVYTAGNTLHRATGGIIWNIDSDRLNGNQGYPIRGIVSQNGDSLILLYKFADEVALVEVDITSSDYRTQPKYQKLISDIETYEFHNSDNWYLSPNNKYMFHDSKIINLDVLRQMN